MPGRRLVFITQQVDPGHPALAATVPKVRALAERVDEVVVLADRAVAGALPGNCRSLSFAAPSRAGRGARFASLLARELARGRPLAVVAHMCPIYAVLAAPLTRPLRVPLLLWYTHWARTRTLAAAARLADTVVSVDRRSFPIGSPKVVPIGHGIDLGEFPCADGQATRDFRLAALGRYSRAKGLEVVVRAVGLALDRGLDVRLEVLGPALNAAEREHRAELERLVRALDLSRRVRLGHAVLRSEVPGVLARASALVNNMQAGAPDKVVFEAAASCRPVVVSNPVFDRLVDGLGVRLRFDRDDPDDLASAIGELAARAPEERRAIGRALRERVAASHSVEHWADAVLEAAAR
ncbi:MAG TPA: glycosyltransferase family 4 protein [Gaiellaceae bacterium]|nr:glycosyltransferase family 4 protein [Gaiellaceae bacterium]